MSIEQASIKWNLNKQQQQNKALTRILMWCAQRDNKCDSFRDKIRAPE